MDEGTRNAAIALYDRYTHGDWGGLPPAVRDRSGGAIDPATMDRRDFMTEMTRIAGSAAAASLLVASISADPAAAAMIPADDRRVKARRMSWPVGGGRMMKGYQAEPAKASGPLGTVLVVHENRGLNAHIEDVARRAAIAGYRAIAPDFLSGSGGTPADQDAARTAIGKLDLSQSVVDAVATLRVARSLPGANGKVGAVGFCWGGAMVNRIAAAAGDSLDAGVPFYGSGLDPALAPRVEAAMLLHYAGLDERVNGTGLPWAQALKAAGKTAEWHLYDGVNHAFHNDTSAERYNEAAAKLAWQRSLDWFGRELG